MGFTGTCTGSYALNNHISLSKFGSKRVAPVTYRDAVRVGRTTERTQKSQKDEI
jgi:hypothetical protein